jgi:hypothetical protein
VLADTTLLIVEPARAPAPERISEIANLLDDGKMNLVIAGSGEQVRRAAAPLLLETLPDTRPARGPGWVLVETLPFGPRRLRVGSLARNLEIQAFEEAPSGFQILARSADDLPVVIAAICGRGLIVLCSESRWFQNRWIGHGDNLEFVLGLLGGQETISIDDRWQAPVQISVQAPSILALVYGTAAGRCVVFAGLTLLLALYLGGLRAGPPPDGAKTARSPTLYVDSLADLQLAARRGAEAYSHFRQIFCIRAARIVGLPPTCTVGELADAIASWTGHDNAAIVELISDFPSPRRAPSWVARLDALSETLSR